MSADASRRNWRARRTSVFVILVAVVLAGAVLYFVTGRSGRIDVPEQEAVELAKEKPPAEPMRPAPQPSEPPQAPVLELAPLELDEDIEATTRLFAPDGPPRIEDAMVVWQKDTDQYVRVLEGESFESTAYMTYRTSELIQVIGNTPVLNPGNHTIVDVLARTRRFSKLLRHVEEAKAEGRSAEAVAILTKVVQTFTAEREKLFAELARLAKEKPEIFDPASAIPEKERWALTDLMVGYALSLPGAPPGLIPVSLEGAKLGVAANVFLLGCTEHADAVGSILSVANCDEDEDGHQQLVKDAFGSVSPAFFRSVELQNWFVIGDALDRIIAACVANEGLSPESRAVANEYLQWRSDQNWPAREETTVFAYDDSLVNPYSFRGTVVRASPTWQPPTEECRLALCLSFGKGRFDSACPDEVTEIIRWAERFEETRRRSAQ